MTDESDPRAIARTVIVRMPPGMSVEIATRSGALWTFVKKENDRAGAFLTVPGNEREPRGVYRTDRLEFPSGEIASVDVVDAAGRRTRAYPGYEPREGDEWSVPAVEPMVGDEYSTLPAKETWVRATGRFGPAKYATDADFHEAAVDFVASAVRIAKAHGRPNEISIELLPLGDLRAPINIAKTACDIARAAKKNTLFVNWFWEVTRRAPWARIGARHVSGFAKAYAMRVWILNALDDPRLFEELDVDMCQTLLPLTEDDAFLEELDMLNPNEIETVRLAISNKCLNPHDEVGRGVLRAVYEEDFPEPPGFARSAACAVQ